MMGQWANGSFNASQFFTPLQMYFSGLESLSQNASPVMGPVKAASRCQLEAVGLMSRRAQAYMEFPARLAKCRTPQDYFAEQQRFWQTSFQQYSETTKRMMDAWAQVSPMAAGGASMEKIVRDYITFGDPREANGQSRSARDRHAA